MPKVFIGVGHGGKDSGAVGNGFKESDLNLSIALACYKELERHGVSVKMSRTNDEDDDIAEEIRECNAYNPDLAVDIHNNAGGGDGAESFCHYGGGKGKTLADNILKEIVKTGQNSRGTKVRKNSSGTDYYGFIRETYAPAVIVECAFVDNAKDIQVIDTEEERKIMGIAIAKGILNTLNIKYMEETKMQRFKDLSESHWAYEAIESLAEKGIVNGYEDGTFRPDKPITRAEVVTLLNKVIRL